MLAERTSQAVNLRRLLVGKEPLVALGVGTALEAEIAEAAGARCVYVSGYATAAWISGAPDIGLIGLNEIADNALRIARKVNVPMIVDADTGYGDVPQMFETVRRLEAVGAAALQIEDQVWPKRCGHMEGKRVIELNAMLRKVDAAARARTEETVLIARTDARQPEGLESAIKRARAYRSAGADVLFIDAPESVEELKRIGSELPDPLLVNLSETGKTPLMSASELRNLGFKVVLFPTTGLRVAARAVEGAFRELVAKGDSREMLHGIMALEDLNLLVGLEKLRAFEDESEVVSK